MDRDTEKILKALDTILKIVIHNNNLAGFISEQVSPPSNKEDSFIAESPKEMVEELYKNNAQYDIIGES